MATGDPSGVQALANGEQVQITFEGLTHSSIVQNSDITASITGVHGFDNTGTHQTNKTRVGIRLKFVSATDSSGDAVCVFDAEEPIYPDGTISLNASAAAISDGSNDSTAFSGQSCTNNSTLAYDKPACNFISKVWEKVTGSIQIEADAAAGVFRGHRSNRGVACVQITVNEPMEVTGITGTFTNGETVTGGTSGATAELIDESGGTLYLRKTSGTWTASETITGGTSAATATYSSGGRAVTKTVTDITRVDAYGTKGWQDTLPAHAATFDFASGGDWTGGIANKKVVCVDAEAFPAIGGSSSSRHSWPMFHFANPDDDLDTQTRYVDPTGTFTLSVNTSGALSIGEGLVGDTSGAEAVVNVAYGSGQSSLSVSRVRGTWSGTESFTSHTGVTGTISSISWNGDDSNPGTEASPFQSLINAVKDCENDSADSVASYSQIYIKGGRQFLGPYTFAQRPTTHLGPVIISRAPGVAEADAVISGSCDINDTDANAGLRTHLFKLDGINIDFKYYKTISGVTDFGYSNFSGGSPPAQPLVQTNVGFILDGVKVIGRGRLADTGPDGWWHDQVFEGLGIYMYDCEFDEMPDGRAKATIARDCYVHDCSNDWHRPFNSLASTDRLGIVSTDNLGNIAINNRMSLDSSGTGTHCDDWQFVGSGTTDYENVAFVQNKSFDRASAQQGPFYNGGNTAMDDTVSRATSVHMSLNVTEEDGTVQISQLDDCFLRGWYCYHNSFGDTIFLRNNYKQRNAFWVRNYFAELSEDSPGLFPNTGYIDNHNADLFGYTAVASDGWDNTSGGSVAALFDDFDTTYLPKTGGDLLDRGYDDPIIPTDAAGNSFPADGSGAVGALNGEGVQNFDLTAQIQSEGTLRLTFSALTGGATFDNPAIDTSSLVVVQDGVTRTVSGTPSVSGDGTGSLSIIVTFTVPLYSHATGGDTDVDLDAGAVSDDNGNASNALDVTLSSGDNSSTQEPSAGGGNTSSRGRTLRGRIFGPRI